MRYLFNIAFIFSVLLSCKEDAKKTTPEFSSLRDTTDLTVRWDTSTYKITSAQASSINNNNLYIVLSNEKRHFFDIEFENKANKWAIAGISQPSMPDCLFVSSEFRVLSQAVNLNQLHFEKNNRFEGSVDLVVIGKEGMFREPNTPFVDKRKWDTILIQGNFSSQVN